MKFRPSILVWCHWSELIYPACYIIFVGLGLLFLNLPLWAAVVLGLMAGTGAFLMERFRSFRSAPEWIEISNVALSVGLKMLPAQVWRWDSIQKACWDEGAGIWSIRSEEIAATFSLSSFNGKSVLCINEMINTYSTKHHFEATEETGPAQSHI